MPPGMPGMPPTWPNGPQLNQFRQQGNPPQQSGLPDPRCQPSQSVRQHIVERLNKQSELLNQAQQRITDLQALAQQGEFEAMQGPKGPGDEQISAQQIEQLKSGLATMTASGLGSSAVHDGGVSGMPIPWLANGGLGVTRNPRFPNRGVTKIWGSMGYPNIPYMKSPLEPPHIQRAIDDQKKQAPKHMAKYFPIEKHQQLEREIQALLQMVSKMNGRGTIIKPFETNSYVKSRDMLLKRILGSGDDDSSDSD